MEEELIDKYKMPTEEHLKILDKLKSEVFSHHVTSSSPSIRFVIGAPGSGKTTYIKNTDFSQYVSINSDDYRKYNKYSNEVLTKYPTAYAKLTNYDAHLWGDELFAYGIANNYSLLREKAPIDESIINTLRDIPNNYDIIIDILVTGNLASLLATRERYEQILIKDKSAKLSSIESHNKCYDLLPSLIESFISMGIKVNYITFYDGIYKITPIMNEYLDILNQLRKASNDIALKNYNKRISVIKNNMLKRNAPIDQFKELDKIEKVYHELERKQ